MKNYFLTSIAIAASQFAVSNVFAVPQVGDQTFTGRVALSRPSIVAGAKLANLSFTGTIQEQASVQETSDVAPPNNLNSFTTTLASPVRVSNSTILNQMKSLLPDGTIKGWSLRIVLPYREQPILQAVKKNQSPVNVPSNLLSVYPEWPTWLDGVVKSSGLSGGAASVTVSTTASGTFLTLEGKSKATGFNEVSGQYYPNYPDDGSIDFTGVGSFTETSKGYTTSVNVSGVGPFNN